ncbi:protein-export chaperone SecB [Mariprofundus ferrooxydans]|jgi:preprotein translocase subunit SecB|uniref:Protein-export protein SecB n=1 Tax=Mariprofundus ferrooxydans PV-1 TaxID=314345 RepID=Q0EZ21_9PROT|nr:protein-export chaperone SecB [Mariprofundus ferrooxydans]EAU54603.1 protein-export protein SecB [Mariprofundus ferrooxydans PV-1]KON48790.1 preprotein translocase subunit SecB [Mariprofundus ferrooxydans]
MTDHNVQDADTDAPAFSLQKIYVKDISFENPNAPGIYTLPASQPKFEINMGVAHKQVDADHWEVSLKISITSHESQNEQLLFEIEIEHAAVFYIRHIDEEQMPILLGVECPTIIFPYARQLISQLTIDGGFMPLLLEPVNFRALFENSRAQAEHQVH